MHPAKSVPFRIGNPATPSILVNGQSYPSAAGCKIDNILQSLEEGGPNKVDCLQFANAAVFGGAGTLQRQFSADGATWINDGAAVVAITPVAVTIYRSLLYRWLVGGNDITGASFYLA